MKVGLFWFVSLATKHRHTHTHSTWPCFAPRLLALQQPSSSPCDRSRHTQDFLKDFLSERCAFVRVCWCWSTEQRVEDCFRRNSRCWTWTWTSKLWKTRGLWEFLKMNICVMLSVTKLMTDVWLDSHSFYIQAQVWHLDHFILIIYSICSILDQTASV